MQTKPFVPSPATLKPSGVRILTVAGPETLSGAALRASAISPSASVGYALNGGDFGLWAPAAALARSGISTNASFVMLASLSISERRPRLGRQSGIGRNACLASA